MTLARTRWKPTRREELAKTRQEEGLYTPLQGQGTRRSLRRGGRKDASSRPMKKETSSFLGKETNEPSHINLSGGALNGTFARPKKKHAEPLFGKESVVDDAGKETFEPGKTRRRGSTTWKTRDSRSNGRAVKKG